MAKKSKPTDQQDLPTYIRQYESEATPVQLSIRIPSTEKKRFEDAQRVLHEAGLDMSLSDVIRNAMRMAAEFVFNQFERPTEFVGGAFSHFDGSNPRVGDVEHSSPGTVEEWGASRGKNDGSTEAPPLEGSMPAESPASGVVFSEGRSENG